MANKTPVWYDSGFGVYSGDDTIHHNYTDSTGNVLTLEKGGTGNEVLQVLNKGELTLKSITGATSAALTVQGLAAQDFLTISDHENADHLLTVRKLTSGSGWITDFKVRDPGAPSNDDVALRITHDIQTNTPPQGADLLSLGYTNATEVYQELFTMKQSGDLYLQGSSGADLLWGTDSGGNIGGSAGNRPDNVYAAATINANGSVLQTLSMQLGPAGATDKTITALQAATSPYIKYVNGSTKWQFSNDGTTPLDFGTSNVASWDDLYALDKALTIDSSTLVWTQTSTAQSAFQVTRELGSGSTTSPIVYINNNPASGTDDQASLRVAHKNNAGGAGGSMVALLSDFTSGTGLTSGTARVYDASITGHASDTSGASLYGYYATGSAIGSANKYAFYSDSNWDYGVYSASPGIVNLTGFTTSQTGFEVATASSGTSAPVTSYKADMTANASDDDYYTGYAAIIQGTTSGLAASYGFSASSGWNYGLYSESPVRLVLSSATNPLAQRIDVTSGGITAGFAVPIIDVNFTQDATDTATINGIDLNLTINVSATSETRGIYVDGDWDYGLYSLSSLYATISPTSSPGGALSIIESDFASPTLANGDFIYHFHAKPTGHASDGVASYYMGLYAEGTATGSAVKYSIYADQNWDYSIYGLAKASFADAFTTTGEAVHAEASSATLGASQVMSALEAAVNGHASDNASALIYGVYANGDTTGAASKYGFYADSGWDYGLYTISPIAAPLTLTNGTAATGWTRANYTTVTSSGTGLQASEAPIVIGGRIVANASDAASAVYYAFHARGDNTVGDATHYGYYADSKLDYGLYAEAPCEILQTGLTANNASFIVDSTSGGLSSSLTTIRGAFIDMNGNAGDTAGNIQGISLTYTDSGGALTSTRAVVVGSGWDHAVYAQSKGYFAGEVPNGVGSSGYWMVEANPIAKSTGIATNDEVAALKATITDDDNDGGAFYYGLYLTTTDNGPATKWGIHIDTTWPADHFAMRIRSGLWYIEEDFGTVTGNTDHIDVNLSGLLNSTNEGRALNLDITPDSSQADGSRWIGVKANMVNVNANDAVGSVAFHANDNWHYALYTDNDLSKQQAPSEGVIHVESDSSSAVATGTYYGLSYYHTRHASDSGGALSVYYAQANSATGSLSIWGLEVGNALNVGVYSLAEQSVFGRGASDWTASTVPVVTAVNSNASNIYPALKVSNASTSISGTCLEISHAYNGGNTQDTMRAVVLTNTSRNRRTSPIELWQPRMSSTTTAEWYLSHGTPGSSQPAHYWIVATSTGEDSIFAPLVLPHGSTLENIVVYLYLLGTPPSAGNRVKAHVYKKSFSQLITNTILATAEVGSGTGTQTISLTSIGDTVDARTYSYFVEIEGPAVSGYTTIYALGLYYEYDITDLGAAPGY